MEPLKNMYTSELLTGFAEAVRQEYPPFDLSGFLDRVMDHEWENRELKDRYRHIAAVLRELLPAGYPEALAVLDKLSGRFSGFPYIFFPEFVAAFGLEHADLSLDALKRYTAMNTSEFAIRPFIEKNPDHLFPVLLEWAGDSNEHVRRLASEGCRPRLPWAPPLRELIRDPSPILPVLERLKRDDSEYVRRSVANNLNDISKDHPGLVLRLAAEWLGQDPRTDRILKHACRTLLKHGNPEALRLFGFGSEGAGLPDGVTVAGLSLEPGSLAIGEELRFSFRLHSASPASFKLQFAVDYRKANGGTSEKRFHLAEKRGFSGEDTVTRRISFKDLSTRKHYPGQHRLRILINGAEAAAEDFLVL